jgi:hypothetical protein
MHLWAWPPASLTFACPPGIDGQSSGALGFYDPASIQGAYTLASVASLALVLGGVFGCYLLLNRSSLGRRFVIRYWVWWLMVAVVSGLATWGVLATAPITALANTCQSNPAAFAQPLPMTTILNRSLAGAAWAFIAFFLLSWLATRPWLLGGIALPRNGFFHNRGCPVPRLTP